MRIVAQTHQRANTAHCLQRQIAGQPKASATSSQGAANLQHTSHIRHNLQRQCNALNSVLGCWILPSYTRANKTAATMSKVQYRISKQQWSSVSQTSTTWRHALHTHANSIKSTWTKAANVHVQSRAAKHNTPLHSTIVHAR
jgi:hypothetical protein